MTDYIETKTQDGTTIRIEVDFASKTGTGFGKTSPAGKSDSDAVTNVYQQTLDTIRACANGVIDTLQNLEALPNAASINFAIKVDAEAGAMIAKSMNDGQFKVALSWKQMESESEANTNEA